MRIDIRELSNGDCFQFIGGKTVFKIINAGLYRSTVSGDVWNIPVFRSMEVLTEDWMKNVEHGPVDK